MQSELRRLVIDLDSLDATIRAFAPDIDLDEIRPKPLPARNHAFRGEMARTVLNMLRQARKPLPAHDIALTFMASRGLASADKPLLRVIQKRVGASLRNYRNKGTVRAVDGPARTVLGDCALGLTEAQNDEFDRYPSSIVPEKPHAVTSKSRFSGLIALSVRNSQARTASKSVSVMALVIVTSECAVSVVCGV
jgi:hypothetical protein